MNFLRMSKIHFFFTLFVAAFLICGSTNLHAESSDNFSKDQKESEETVDGSAQFMVEQMPLMPPPQLINAQPSPAKPLEKKTDTSENKTEEKSTIKKWIGFAKNLVSKKEETSEPSSEQIEKTTEVIKETTVDKKDAVKAAEEKAVQQVEKKAESESQASTAAVKIQTESAAVKASAQSQTASPVQPAVVTAESASQAPAAAATAATQAMAAKPVVAQPANQQVVTPAKKDAAPLIEEKALPKEPVSQTTDAAPAQPSLSDLPLKEGVYMIAPLEAEMKLAAQQLDFEKAIQIRNQIQQIQQIEGVSEIIDLEQRMIFAAQELRFEEAIQLR
ncbi:MAG: UvrB/UvrC motif-containing protein, partial [Candidatus Omnitrophica bacterium]|nr:UvrB/UvrC motif-containing protein [Candidatus Omnitrophota bacterium]